MVETFTASGLKTEYEEEPTADEWTGRVIDGLNRMYPGRAAVRTRTGLQREGKSAEATDAILTDLAEVNWEDTLLPPIPQPAARRCLSETSWEDRCLPSLSTVGTGSLSELAWEDRLLP